MCSFLTVSDAEKGRRQYNFAGKECLENSRPETRDQALRLSRHAKMRTRMQELQKSKESP
jgi:hypothetical protein